MSTNFARWIRALRAGKGDLSFASVFTWIVPLSGFFPFPPLIYSLFPYTPLKASVDEMSGGQADGELG
jgi:hypothetical protein